MTGRALQAVAVRVTGVGLKDIRQLFLLEHGDSHLTEIVFVKENRKMKL